MLKEGCPTIVPSYLVIDCLILGLFFVAFILSLAPLILRNIRKSGDSSGFYYYHYYYACINNSSGNHNSI